MPRKKSTKAPKKQTAKKPVEVEATVAKDDFAEFMAAVNFAANSANEEKVQEENIVEEVEAVETPVETNEAIADDFAEDFVEEAPTVEEVVESEPVKEEVKEEKPTPKQKSSPKRKNPTMRQVYGYDYMGLIYGY